MARKTSRKPVQVGKTTPRARGAQRLYSGLRNGSGTRKGKLNHRHVHATEYKGRDPMFKGRIAVDRAGGILEFPDYEQFERMARQEKIPKAMVDKAFGHLKPPKSKKRRTSRKRKQSRRAKTKRRTSRRKGGFLDMLFPNARRRSIQRDAVFVPHTIDGEDVPLRAVTAAVPGRQQGAFGSDRGIMATAAGQTVLLPYEQAFVVLERWMSRRDFAKAFGHLREAGALGMTERRRPIPTHYGPRSMRLGHRPEVGVGPAAGGIVKGQLVMFHKPTGSIVWQAYDDSANYPDKPIWIWFGAHKVHVDFPKAMSGARVGRGETRELVGAVDRGIPPMAMLSAFDYLLTPSQRRDAYRVFAQRR